MEVPLSPETESRIQQLAADAGADPGQWAAEALERFARESDALRQAIRQGLESGVSDKTVSEIRAEAEARLAARP